MREKLIALHSVLCRSIYAEYDEAQRAPVIDLLKTAENLIANGVVISNSETATKWIPVTERLPNESDANARGYVLAIAKSDGCINAHAYHAVSRFPTAFTHWMPLPEPPKGE